MFEIGYSHYAVILFLISGGLVLYVDVRIYKRDDLKKEKKAAKILGWLNITLGLLIFLVDWSYYIWFV
ncbi:CLC_0170 family protein [Alkalihalobacterium alkalinitrilicum]|uniref:CLC_0170 family protein n=1 Tax=Alkalihalobacterium alkalinitrilicum TaxID=427920 RepID=UPI000994BCBB|nr:CLC_0170 family protein [Alkalihalobacterium alkalinitrilicum]